MFEQRMNAWRPTRQQEDLLKAVLLPDARWREAWERWRNSVRLEHLPDGSYRLIPLLLKRMEHEGIRDPWIPRLRGIYRHTWARNQVILREGAAAARVLGSNGIRVMLIKGAAMIHACYRDPGLCPMNDMDLMVPEDRAMEAVSLFRKAGWKPTSRYEGDIPERFIRIGHSHPFLTTRDIEVDLHWHLLHVLCTPGADAPFWDRAGRVEFFGNQVDLPDPTDQLLLTCLHGMYWSAASSLRWVVDAGWLIRSFPIDWDRPATYARFRGMVLPLTFALAYLRETLEFPIPKAVLSALQSSPRQSDERLIFLTYAGPGNLVWNTLSLWFRHKYFSRAKPANFFRLVWELPEFLMAYWALDHPVKIMPTFLGKVWGHFFPIRGAASSLPRRPPRGG